MLDRRAVILRDIAHLTRSASGAINPYPAHLGDLRIVNANLLWLAFAGHIESTQGSGADRLYNVTRRGTAWLAAREARNAVKESS